MRAVLSRFFITVPSPPVADRLGRRQATGLSPNIPGNQCIKWFYDSTETFFVCIETLVFDIEINFATVKIT